MELDRDKEVLKVKAKLLNIPFNRTEVTFLTINEVKAIYATLDLSYKLTLRHHESVTYYKYQID